MNMFIHFVNRVQELAFLEEQFARGSSFVVLYGRRRVGKTELLKRFVRNKKNIFLAATQEVEKELMESFSKETAVFFKDSALLIQPFFQFRQLLDYLKEKELKRTVLVIDEFPYLVDANKAVPSLLQHYWENFFKPRGLQVVLCGSSIGAMESEVLGRKSPLYGRRTGQWKLDPLSFRDFADFFPTAPFEKLVEFFSITGGIPLYVLEFNANQSALENARRTIARRGSLLYQEAEFLLKEELREPKTYFSILKELAKGKTVLNELANALGTERTALGRYLDTLMELGLIESVKPVTADPKTKKTNYRLSDHYFSFWFQFVYPFKKDLDSFDFQSFDECFKQQFNAFAGKKFELICQEAIRLQKPFEFTKTGNWWGAYRENNERKTAEIDLVAVNEKKQEILFGECKWKTNINAPALLKELQQKAALVPWNNQNRKEHFALFAKSFGKNRNVPENTQLIDLTGLKKIFFKKHSKAEQ